MTCFGPLKAYRAREPVTGKSVITFDSRVRSTRRYRDLESGKMVSVDPLKWGGETVPLELPCGQCLGCRLARRREWAVRCFHEQLYHQAHGGESWFATLTYNEESLPDYGCLRKSDLQLFMMRLRKEYGLGIRYYACGEYGERYGRPHYHAILFNLKLDKSDLGFERQQYDAKFPVWECSKIADIWQNGFVTVAPANVQTMAYTAGYVVEKLGGDRGDAKRTVRGADGKVVMVDGKPLVKPAEFGLMSKGRSKGAGAVRGGIGVPYYSLPGKAEYFVSHGNATYKGGKVAPLPRAFDLYLKDVDEVAHDLMKAERKAKAAEVRANNPLEFTLRRLRIQEQIVEAQFKLKPRKGELRE